MDIDNNTVIINIKGSQIKIKFEEGAWKIDFPNTLKDQLPKPLDYFLSLSNDNGNFDLTFSKVSTSDIDYPWIFLIKILNKEYPSFDLNEKEAQKAEELLQSFFNLLIKDLQFQSTQRQDSDIVLSN